ncbi:MAG: amino acid permease [Oscillatoriales cyanobacterium SM2_2_1]|nr:amino acid permease [Oscillatoriales cyanobacterium SM2_2_1]
MNQPRPSLRVFDAIALVVGIVIGAGIFSFPPLVAANAGSAGAALGLWLLGGVISLVGALCYAELTAAYPDAGGDYLFLRKAFGAEVALLFVWARMTVIQTGSIALLALVLGDNLSAVFRLGDYSSAIYAEVVIVTFTALNVAGIRIGTWVQNVAASLLFLGLVLVISAGAIAVIRNGLPVSSNAPSEGSLGLSMVFVLLTYGGWNEAAFISAEVEQGPRNMARVMVGSIGLITLAYLLINAAYLGALGYEGTVQARAVGVVLMQQVVGSDAGILIALIVAIATVTSIHGTILTGARSAYALGTTIPRLEWLGQWSERANVPQVALLTQGAIAMMLILVGAWERKGIETVVEYTAPVFWLFFLLTGLSIFVLRTWEPDRPRPFRIPLYPLLPIAFCTTCLFMLYSSLAYANANGNAWIGLTVVAAGTPLFLSLPPTKVE